MESPSEQTPHSDQPLHDEWFNKPPVGALSEPPRPITLPPPRPAGDPVWSALGGGVAGAVAGALLLSIAFCLGGGRGVGLGIAATLGGAMGGVALGRVMRRLVRTGPRIAFGAVLAAAMWVFAYAFILRRFSPQMASGVSFGSSILFALAYGACVGAFPAARVRAEHGRRS
jgi:hypothetical protein